MGFCGGTGRESILKAVNESDSEPVSSNTLARKLLETCNPTNVFCIDFDRVLVLLWTEGLDKALAKDGVDLILILLMTFSIRELY